MKRILALSVLVLGCGASDGGTAPELTGGHPGVVKPDEKAGGDPAGANAPGGPYVMLVADDAALPKCDAAAKDRLVYVKAAATFKHCDGAAWTDIDLKGKDGAAGAAGPAGPKGDGMTVAETWDCSIAAADLDPDPNVERRGVDLSVTRFSSGDYFVTCQSAIAYYSGSGDLDRGSASDFYSGSSVAVGEGKLLCDPFHVFVEYSIATHKATYVNKADETQKATVDCTKGYP